MGVSVLQGFLGLPPEAMLLGGGGSLSYSGNREWFGGRKSSPKPATRPSPCAGWDTSVGHPRQSLLLALPAVWATSRLPGTLGTLAVPALPSMKTC